MIGMALIVLGHLFSECSFTADDMRTHRPELHMHERAS